MALLGKAAGDVGGGFGIVFDDQDAHLLGSGLTAKSYAACVAN